MYTNCSLNTIQPAIIYLGMLDGSFYTNYANKY